DDLLDQDRGAVAAGHGADGRGEPGAGGVVDVARAVAGAAAELGERERGLVGLRPVPRAQLGQPVGDPGGSGHGAERAGERGRRGGGGGGAEGWTGSSGPWRGSSRRISSSPSLSLWPTGRRSRLATARHISASSCLLGLASVSFLACSGLGSRSLASRSKIWS